MKYLHTMVRVRDLAASLKFYCDGLGLKESKDLVEGTPKPIKTGIPKAEAEEITSEDVILRVFEHIPVP